jgi:hypothetical protein
MRVQSSDGNTTAHSSSVEVEDELEVVLWRLSVWLEDLVTVRLLKIRCQEKDSDDIVKA